MLGDEVGERKNPDQELLKADMSSLEFAVRVVGSYSVAYEERKGTF